MEYFVIAQRELVLAFKLVGVDGKSAANRREALDVFNRLTGNVIDNAMPVAERPKILILSEDVSVMLEDEVIAWQKKGEFPLIVEIPPLSGHLEGKLSLTDSIRQAVGVSV